MIGLYIVAFLVMMWISQMVVEQLVARQQRLWTYVWMTLIFIIQGALVYGFVGQLVIHMRGILSLFYDK
ncbi:hypothetical protein [Staphylococcus lutrae]|uniref:DUF1146 domain-containing protein n=1 Tax=Staphylococcus lutrae TaxID=155085 RepID=A0AAC9RP31_9STAP|nr:hypothetical protein [Staphylococcus lutrae]ARJ51248.1 hypothetical protein B5P37_07970 [Staphylococcus lutrae]PNZ39494.1 hypothetical protein CD134_01300 [Staphylococcus lutrae]